MAINCSSLRQVQPRISNGIDIRLLTSSKTPTNYSLFLLLQLLKVLNILSEQLRTGLKVIRVKQLARRTVKSRHVETISGEARDILLRPPEPQLPRMNSEKPMRESVNQTSPSGDTEASSQSWICCRSCTCCWVFRKHGVCLTGDSQNEDEAYVKTDNKPLVIIRRLTNHRNQRSTRVSRITDSGSLLARKWSAQHPQAAQSDTRQRWDPDTTEKRPVKLLSHSDGLICRATDLTTDPPTNERKPGPLKDPESSTTDLLTSTRLLSNASMLKQTRYITTMFEAVGSNLGAFDGELQRELSYWSARENVICCEILWSTPSDGRCRKLEHTIRDNINRQMIQTKYRLTETLNFRHIPHSETAEHCQTRTVRQCNVYVGMHKQYTPAFVKLTHVETATVHKPKVVDFGELLQACGEANIARNSYLLVHLVTITV